MYDIYQKGYITCQAQEWIWIQKHMMTSFINFRLQYIQKSHKQEQTEQIQKINPILYDFYVCVT